MKKKVSGVYVIKNVGNGRVYIGSSSDIQKRWSSHISMLKNNRHTNKELQEDFNLYGWDRFSFRIKEECLQRDLYKLEDKYISRYDSDILYNKKRIINKNKKIRRGREAANFKKNLSDRNLGTRNPNVKYTEETILLVKQMLSDGICTKEISEKVGISTGYIISIKNGHKWNSLKLEDKKDE